MKKSILFLIWGFAIVSVFSISINLFSNYSTIVEASDNINNTVDSNKTEDLKEDIREIAFNQLSDEQKSLIKGTWEEAKTKKIVVQPETAILYDESYAGKEAIAVEFNLNVEYKPNNMIVLVSQENSKLIGLRLID